MQRYEIQKILRVASGPIFVKFVQVKGEQTMLFKKRLQNRALERLQKRAPANFMPIGNAHRVAFILESDEEGIEESVDYLINQLIDRGIEWIGLVVERQNKRSVDFSQKGNFIIIRKADLTYYGLPKSI
jgi:hypothetical protein